MEDTFTREQCVKSYAMNVGIAVAVIDTLIDMEDAPLQVKGWIESKRRALLAHGDRIVHDIGKRIPKENDVIVQELPTGHFIFVIARQRGEMSEAVANGSARIVDLCAEYHKS